MIALDARTGKELWNVEAADPKEKYSFTHAPLVIKDKVIEGTAGGEFGIRGFIAAWDVNTGKEAWRFYTIPGPGEPGNETWAGDSWKHGGGPAWVTGSYDPETNLTFWGIGNPGPDWNGDGRLGDNLYTCSVVALDADTGKLKWYYQFSPHNEFDWGFRAGSGAREHTVERRSAQGDAVGQSQRDVLRSRPHERRVSAGQAIRQSELGHGVRREGTAKSARPAPSPVKDGDADLSWQSGRDELVQSFV